jgi:hypothetical protein
VKPRRRYCNACRQKNQREANRNRQRRHYERLRVST